MMQNLFANSPALNHPRSITRPATLMMSLRWNKEMSVSTISTGHPSPCVLCSCFCWKESKELNQAKDRLKVLQHELACATAVLKVKASGLEESKAAPSKFAPIEAHQADNKGTSANVHHSTEIQSSVPFNTDRSEAPPDKINKRTPVNARTSKRKSESCEGTKETNTLQQSQRHDVQPTGSLHHEDQRSSRLNPGSCEMAEASCESLHTDTDVPSSYCVSVPELDEPNSGNEMRKATQDELLCSAAVHIKASVLKCNQEEIQEAHSGITTIEDPRHIKIIIRPRIPTQFTQQKLNRARVRCRSQRWASARNACTSNDGCHGYRCRDDHVGNYLLIN